MRWSSPIRADVLAHVQQWVHAQRKRAIVLARVARWIAILLAESVPIRRTREWKFRELSRLDPVRYDLLASVLARADVLLHADRIIAAVVLRRHTHREPGVQPRSLQHPHPAKRRSRYLRDARPIRNHV
jgi:hypothetical protein